MIGLVVELTRLRWRRAVLLLLGAAVVLPALLLAGTAWETRPMSDADVEAVLDDRYAQREVARCERDPDRFMDLDPAGGILVGAALVAEHLCTIRKDDADEQPGPAPGGLASDPSD